MLNLEYVEVFWVNLDLTSISKAIQEENSNGTSTDFFFSDIIRIIDGPKKQLTIVIYRALYIGYDGLRRSY